MDPNKSTTFANPQDSKGKIIVISHLDSDEEDDDDDDSDVDDLKDVKDVRVTARRYLERNNWNVNSAEITDLMISLTMGCGCHNGPVPTCPPSWHLAQDDFSDLYNMVKMARNRGIEEESITEHVVACLEMRKHRPLFRLELVKLVESFL